MRRNPVFLTLAFAIAGAACQAAPVVVKPADAPALKKAIASRKGHVVMVNFWATWCGPCVAEFPTLVKFAKANKSKGLDFLAVSADMSKDVPTKVQPFLARRKYVGPAYLKRAADPDAFINAFDPRWQGELPETFIYNKQGTLVKSFSGAQTEKSLGAVILPLLKK